ncbi:hypothetical protein [Yunchengibacter salinarum]|uniref:hypothetical protein n=1 Tax=Yunchengibacter salinarum TaxID=3133399 RepID=UPI0035B65C93
MTVLTARLVVAFSFIAAAFLTSLDPERVDWPVFLPVIAVGALAVWVLHRGKATAARESHVLDRDRAALHDSLDRLIAALDDLVTRKDSIPTHDMRFEIDARLRDDLRRFADARDSLKHLYGLEAYADIVSSFAAGERYVNRVWSASADGYVDEVRAVVDKARDQFGHARDQLRAVMATGTGNSRGEMAHE